MFNGIFFLDDWCSLAHSHAMLTVIESKRFSQDADALFSGEEVQELITFLALNPEAGDVIQATGGFRKLRWAAQGKGKRGGARIVYLFWTPGYPLLLVRAYAKSFKIDLTAEEKKAMRDYASSIKRAHKQ